MGLVQWLAVASLLCACWRNYAVTSTTKRMQCTIMSEILRMDVFYFLYFVFLIDADSKVYLLGCIGPFGYFAQSIGKKMRYAG